MTVSFHRFGQVRLESLTCKFRLQAWQKALADAV
jgi:hypothetical protein